MHTTYHLSSAQEVSTDILEAIKAAFKSRPITITVEEGEDHFELTSEMKTVLEERLQENEKTYLTGKASVKQLKQKYGL